MKRSIFLIFLVLILAACGTAEPDTAQVDFYGEGEIASSNETADSVADEPTDIPPTDIPPTDIPPTDIPPTDIPPTDIPPTDIPPTDIPPTDIPPTDIPPTDIPPTDIPPTDIPPTDIPPTAVPPTAVPPTAVPPTAVPPTAVPPTAVPPTAVPPTAVPPTAVPPTAVPPAAAPAQNAQGTYQGLPVGFTSSGRPYLGNINARTKIEEFSDYQCPICQHANQNGLAQLRVNEIKNGEVVLIFYDFPLAMHPQADAAANAARCAGEYGAGAYWGMHDRLFANPGAWSIADPSWKFVQMAGQIGGINTEKFKACVDANKYITSIYADIRFGMQKGVTGTPNFFINGNRISGSMSHPTWVRLISESLY